MNWRFWRRKAERFGEEVPPERDLHEILAGQTALIQKLQEQGFALWEQQQETLKLVNSLARLQHRWQLENAGKLERALKDQGRLAELERTLETAVAGLLVLQDDLDAIMGQASVGGTDPLLEVIGSWQKQIELLLREIGVEPIPLAGTLFDPETAQAVDTVTMEQARQKMENSRGAALAPYLVVEVVQKGYKKISGKILRKGLVVTIAEGSDVNESKESNQE